MIRRPTGLLRAPHLGLGSEQVRRSHPGWERLLAAVAPSVERMVGAGRLPPTPMHLLYFAVTGAVAGMIQGPLARRIGRPDPCSADELTAAADVLALRVLDGTIPSS